MPYGSAGATLYAIYKTAAITVPSLVDAMLGRLTRERADRRLADWSRCIVRRADVDLTVEGLNDVPREWLPRQIDIDKVSDEEIQDIVVTANLTPRKCLGFKTPFQAILRELGKHVQIRFS
jgi:hypothetical protein